MGQFKIGMHKIHAIFNEKVGSSEVTPYHWPLFREAPAQCIVQPNTLPYMKVDGWLSDRLTVMEGNQVITYSRLSSDDS